jgi:hypothetical protein
MAKLASTVQSANAAQYIRFIRPLTAIRLDFKDTSYSTCHFDFIMKRVRQSITVKVISDSAAARAAVLPPRHLYHHQQSPRFDKKHHLKSCFKN